MNEFGPALELDVKNLDEAGYVQGIAAAYGNVDFGNDRIMPGAASKSLLGKSAMPMLLYHDQKRPVGRWAKIQETPEGILVEGKISTKTRDGAEAYELVKDGALSGLSIGYKTRRARLNGKVRELHEIDVFETSFVTVGMNPSTGVLSIKSIIEDGAMPTLPQFEEFLREAGFSKSQATAIAGKGLTPLLRGEPGNDQTVAVLAALAEHLRS
jgi:HK97 family phage prohead protease